MIDLESEDVFPLYRGGAERSLQIHGDKSVHPQTLRAWARTGVRADDGTIVRLETIRIGRVRCTSRQALQRFCEAVSGRPGPARMPPSRARALEAARACERLGL